MAQVIVFAGTTEGRRISEWLAGQGIETLVCVATEYGKQMVRESAHLTVLQGRMEPERMKELFLGEGKPLVVDATHPYAEAVSRNIRSSCEEAGSEYLRLIRPSLADGENRDIVTVNSVEEAVDWLSGTKGRIFVATGSKELHRFTRLADYRERVYARVLASPQVVDQCAKLGFSGSHLICMQGPFSRELNTAMLKHTGASFLVTKESGKAGGFCEKLEAAAEAGVKVILVGRPPEQEGMSVEEGIRLLRERFGLRAYGERRAVLAGIGMGVPENMTVEARKAFEEADCILGAGRMLESFRGLGKPLYDAYDPEKMACYLREHPEYGTIAVALSGDVGFYSGAKRLITVLEQEGIHVELLAGISSPSYLCSRLRIPWEDVKLISIHGRSENLIAAVRENFRTFVLLGGREPVAELCAQLLEYNLGHVTLFVGEWLHYEGERIRSGTPEELMGEAFDGLCAALIENPHFYKGVRSCIRDEDFIRGDAPMTKSELRCLSVAKLRLHRDSVVYDIGAGTGSVSVEAALQVSEGMVWAVEKKEAAADLIRENCKRFAVSNVEIVRGNAPEAFADLPAPTHAFIGGSSGNLREILELLIEKNPKIRIVISAVTLETVGEALDCLKKLPVCETEILQIQVSRAKALGRYQLMAGQNPVYLFSCQGKEA